MKGKWKGELGWQKTALERFTLPHLTWKDYAISREILEVEWCLSQKYRTLLNDLLQKTVENIMNMDVVEKLLPIIQRESNFFWRGEMEKIMIQGKVEDRKGWARSSFHSSDKNINYFKSWTVLKTGSHGATLRSKSHNGHHDREEVYLYVFWTAKAESGILNAPSSVLKYVDNVKN